MTAVHGDEFAEYAAASIPSLRRLALLLCRNWHDADDLVQAALSKMCQHWYRAAAADSTDAYARAILVREFVRGQRTAWARRVSVTDQPPEIRAPAADLDTLLDLQTAITGASVVTIEDAVPGGRPLSLDLTTRSWSLGPKAPVPGRQEAHEFWTGSEVLVWGGGVPVGDICCRTVKPGYSYTP